MLLCCMNGVWTHIPNQAGFLRNVDPCAMALAAGATSMRGLKAAEELRSKGRVRECRKCNLRADKQMMWDHLASIHLKPNGPPFRCPLLSATFPPRGRATEHIPLHHKSSDVKPEGSYPAEEQVMKRLGQDESLQHYAGL